ncbi:DUF6680 family protein [Acidovorax lacteus]|uniref:DUF6680 domain-containing protein n=1 Tax=Acidovorax lacteus TaxID=1924988 RepID=A0ABP8KW49_9BURK
MQVNDWLVVIATLLSPLIALQVSEWITRRRQVRDEQFRVFKTLMSTRASNLDPRHVECLNLIDVVFHSGSKREVEIRRLWKQYLHHLSDRNYPKDSWGARRVELLVELLHSMAVFLGYDFDKTHITTQCYYPDGYGDLETENGAIRRYLTEILSGNRALPMWITNVPEKTGEHA